MDVFASLLCQSGNGSGGRELEQLVNKLALSNAQSSEMFVAYGYLAKVFIFISCLFRNN
jgi:hypothetical protein